MAAWQASRRGFQYTENIGVLLLQYRWVGRMKLACLKLFLAGFVILAGAVANNPNSIAVARGGHGGLYGGGFHGGEFHVGAIHAGAVHAGAFQRASQSMSVNGGFRGFHGRRSRFGRNLLWGSGWGGGGGYGYYDGGGSDDTSIFEQEWQRLHPAPSYYYLGGTVVREYGEIEGAGGSMHFGETRGITVGPGAKPQNIK